MSNLEEFLRLEIQGSPLTGKSPLLPERPTSSGLNWVAVSTGLAGLVYRYQTGSLDRLSIDGDNNNITVSASCPIDCGVVHIAASSDGRLLAVACHDGSLRCFDSTSSSSLSHRWTLPNSHSHVTPDLTTPPSSDRSCGAAATGPVRSLEFAPGGYNLLLVDNQKGLCIYNAAMSTPFNLISPKTSVSSASWGPSQFNNAIAVGNSNGSVEVFRLHDSKKLDLISNLGCPSQDDEEDVFSCTHMHWGSTRLIAGLCRVIPDVDEPDDADEDDTADHEAILFSTGIDLETCNKTDEWSDHGDVVPFFSVPKSGRHVFFTSFLTSKQNIFVVATNVGTDIGIVAQEEDSVWKVVELEDGASATTPTTEDDEYCYPVGLAIIQVESGSFRLILGSTDGSISMFAFRHETDPDCFVAIGATASAGVLPDSPVETIGSSSGPPELASEPTVSEARPPSAEESKSKPTPEFSFRSASGGSGTTSAFSFGSTGSSSFDANSTVPKPTSEQGKPSSFASPGSFSFGTPSPLGASIATPTDKSKGPSFGAPAGGSLFGSKTDASGGFAALSSSGKASNTFGSSFGTTSSLGGIPAASSVVQSKGPSFGSPSGGSIFGAGTGSGGFGALASSGKVSSSFGSGSAAFGTTSSSAQSPFAPRPDATAKEADAAEDSDETEKSTDSEDDEQKPATGQASSLGTFGSGSTAPTFSFGSKPPAFSFTTQSSSSAFGAAKAPATSSASPFSAFAPSPNAPSSSASPFSAFGSSTTPTSISFAKPLFGAKPTEPVIKAGEQKKASAPEPANSAPPQTQKATQVATTAAAGKDASKINDKSGTVTKAAESGKASSGFDKPKSSSLYPPVASKAPTPFSVASGIVANVGKSEKGDDKPKSSSSHLPEAPIGISSSPDAQPQVMQTTPTTAAGKKAANAFDKIDSDKTGTLPSSSFETLLEELGENFHGDEFDVQLAICDPSRSGRITRSAFVDWYVGLVEDDTDDNSSLDTEEREERAEEEANAIEKFGKLGKMVDGSLSIPGNAFGDLIESLGSAYCEEAHRSTLKKLTSSNGMIKETDFLAWYVDWLFATGDSEDEYDDNTDDASGEGKSEDKPSLGSIFKVEAGSWRCDMCSVPNNKDAKKCVACEAPRPGTEGDDTGSGDEKSASTSGVQGSIGSGGFSFRAPTTGGFTFGAPATAGSDTKTATPETASGGFLFSASSTGGGFSFGTPGASSSGSALGSGTGGFNFGAPSASSGTGGFNFGAPSASSGTGGFNFGAPSASSSTGGFQTQTGSLDNSTTRAKPPSSSSPSAAAATPKPEAKKPTASMPPMPKQAPTPFSVQMRKPPTASMPPMPKQAPTPVSEQMRKPPTASIPPMPKQAPTPVSEQMRKPPTASIPPMPKQAPTPVSEQMRKPPTASMPPVPKQAPTPVSEQMRKPPTASMPPMPKQAPTPVSEQMRKPPTASMPPMPKTAPTPVSEQMRKPTAIFPPVPAKGPTPVSEQMRMPNTLAKQTAASPFANPPSVQAPKAFSSLGKPAAQPKPPSSTPSTGGGGGGGGYPPMAAASPTPFSSLGKQAAAQPKPPLLPSSGVAGSTFSIFGKTDIRDKAPPPSSFPPASSKSSTSFAGTGMPSTISTNIPLAPEKVSKASSIGKDSASAVSQSPSGGSDKPNSSIKQAGEPPRGIRVRKEKAYSSEVARQFVTLTEMMEQTLIDMSRRHAKNDDLEKKINELITQGEDFRRHLLAIDAWLVEQKKENTFLLGRKTDASRQIGESQRLINNLITKTNGLSSILEEQPLDYESEQHRRKFASSMMTNKMQLDLLKRRIQALDCSKEEGPRAIFRGVGILYESVKGFNNTISRIKGKVEQAEKSVPMQSAKKASGRSTYGLDEDTPSTKRQRPRALFSPFRGATSKKADTQVDTQKWKSIESSLHDMGSENASTVRIGGLSRLTRSSADSQKPEVVHARRNLGVSLLLSPEKRTPAPHLPASTLSTTTRSIRLFSPPSATKSRSGWDRPSTIDQNRAKQMSLSLPGSLKEISVSEASRPALMALGTTPEKIHSSLDVQRDDSLARSSSRKPKSLAPIPATTKSSTTANKISTAAKSAEAKKPAAAFPPLPTSAPKSVSELTAKPPKSGSSKSSASSYPPLSATAPKNPFSGSKGIAGSTKPETNSVAEKVSSNKSSSGMSNYGSGGFASALSGMKGLGDSLFSSSGNTNNATSAPLTTTSGSTQAPGDKEPDYASLLTSFYQKHNPAKISEVNKTLEKYKGQEVAMFKKLSNKYKVPSPLDELNSGKATQATAPAPPGIPSLPQDTRAPAASPFSTNTGPGPMSAPSPFGGSPAHGLAPAASPFGKPPAAGPMTTPSPFGKPVASSSQFGQTGMSTANASPFTSSTMTPKAPFGSSVAPAPISQPPPSNQAFNGQNARELLMTFYQQKNPSKIADVEKLLAKYRGKEDQLFYNLAKRYQLDPSVFGLPSAPAPAATGFGSPQAPSASAFGQQSGLGSGQATFGHTSGFGIGQPTSSPGFGGSGGHTFGAGATLGGSSFGSLAHTSSPSPFGAPSGGFGAPSSGFGSPPGGAPFGQATPFGAPRR